MRRFGRFAAIGAFVAAYGVFSLGAYLAAPALGRTPLPCFAGEGALAMQSPLYCLMHRHYVAPRLKRAAEAMADHVAKRHPGTVTLALDGGFPFLDSFPMLPHLSHADGRKLDFAFYYKDEDGYARGRARSPIGYWAFETPRAGERRPCRDQDGWSLRWRMAWFEALHNDLELEPRRTRTALRWLKTRGPGQGIGKVFVEPHLADRLGVGGGVIRFQGCAAARHDDHIHVQLAH